MTNRRAFLKALCAVPLAAVAAPYLPVPVVARPQLLFHKDAFALTMAPLQRFDVLYGFATCAPDFACRIEA